MLLKEQSIRQNSWVNLNPLFHFRGSSEDGTLPCGTFLFLRGQPLNQQPRVSLAGKGGAPTRFALSRFLSRHLQTPVFPTTTLSYSASAPRSHHQRHDWAELPPPEQRVDPKSSLPPPTRPPQPPGDEPLGYLAGPGSESASWNPGESGGAGRRRVALVHHDPRAARALGAGHSARASSERPGLGYAMRWKRPVRAAVPRDVSVATEMTSDPGASLGGGGLGGRRSRCYGNHVAGSGGAGDTGRACQTGSLTPARVFAGYPRIGYHARIPVRPRSRRTARECGPGAQVAAFTRGARAFRGKGAGRQEGANLLAEAPKFRSGRGWAQSPLDTGRPAGSLSSPVLSLLTCSVCCCWVAQSGQLFAAPWTAAHQASLSFLHHLPDFTETLVH